MITENSNLFKWLQNQDLHPKYNKCTKELYILNEPPVELIQCLLDYCETHNIIYIKQLSEMAFDATIFTYKFQMKK